MLKRHSVVVLSLSVVVAMLAPTAIAVGSPQRKEIDSTQATSYTFADWGRSQELLDANTQHPVAVLLTKLGTDDCTEANRRALPRTLFDLARQDLRDISPLATLPLLQELRLTGIKAEMISAL